MDRAYREGVFSSKKYKSIDRLFVPDSNNGDYLNGFINFDSLSLLKSQIHTPHTWSVTVPLKIAAPTGVQWTGNTDDDMVCFAACGMPGLFAGQKLQLTGGQMISEDAPSRSSAIFRMVKTAEMNSSSWNLSTARDSQYALDTNSNLTPSFKGYLSGSSAAYQNAVGPIEATSDTTNEGFRNRLDWFKQKAVFKDNAYYIVCDVPLRDVFTFYAGCQNTLWTNVPFMLTIRLALNDSGTYRFMNSTKGAPTITVNTTTVQKDGKLIPNICRLRYDRYELNADQMLIFTGAITKGLQWNIPYTRLTEQFLQKQDTVPGETTRFENVTLNSSLRKPEIIHIFATKAGSWAPNAEGYNSPSTFTQPILNPEVFIDNISYSDPPQSQDDVYYLTERCFLYENKSDLISPIMNHDLYDRAYRGVVSIPTWHQRRILNPTDNKNISVKFDILAQAGATQTDIYLVAEGREVLPIYIDNNQVSIRRNV